MAIGIPLVVTGIVVLLLAAFVPCLLYLEWIRNLQRHEREPWRELIKMFVWGALAGTTISLILNTTVGDLLSPAVGVGIAIILPVVVAPIVEEAAKGIGLVFVKDPFLEAEDGIVYGAAVGFGFAATENVLYGMNALLLGGIAGFLITAVLRTLSSALLHASASSILGYGWSRRRAKAGGPGLFAHYAGAVGLHALFNGVAVGGSIILGGSAAGALISLPLAIGIAWGAFLFQRKRLTDIERANEIPEAAPYVDPYEAYAHPSSEDAYAHPAQEDAARPREPREPWDAPSHRDEDEWER